MFDTLKRGHFRQEVIMVELLLDQNDPNIDFSVEPNSYNTPKTTISNLAFNPNVSKKSYLFTNQTIPKLTSTYFPNLININQTTPELKIGENIGTRASGTVTIGDFNTNDAYELPAPYNDRRVLNSSFWGKLISRNYIRNRIIVIYRGYLDGDNFSILNFQREKYIIKDIVRNKDGSVNIQFIDPLYYTNETKAKMPRKSSGKLNQNIFASSTNLEIFTDNMQEYGEVTSISLVRINSEFIRIQITSMANGVVYANINERGVDGTEPSDHNASDLIQACYEAVDKNVVDIIKDAIGFTKIKPEFIPSYSWEIEKNTTLQSYNLSTIISKPTEVKKILSDLIRHCGGIMSYDTVAGLVVLRGNPEFAKPDLIVDKNIYEQDSVIIKDLTGSQVTRAAINYDKISFIGDDSEYNYKKGYQFIDDLIEAEDAFDDIHEAQTINSNWLRSGSTADQIALSIVNREVARKSKIPFETKFTIDSEYIGLVSGQEGLFGSAFGFGFSSSEFGGPEAQILNAKRVWLGSVVEMTNHLLISPDGSFLTYRGQITKLEPKGMDKWEVTMLSINQVVAVEEDWIFSNATYTNLLLTDIAPPVSGRPTVVIFDENTQIYSTSPNIPALDTGVYPDGLTLILRGKILGSGGDGGNSDSPPSSDGDSCAITPISGSYGKDGGDAIHINTANVIIDNSVGSLIYGGGGGGPGTIGQRNTRSFFLKEGLGGGGGQGFVGGLGGVHLSLPQYNGQGGSDSGPGLLYERGGFYGEDAPDLAVTPCDESYFVVIKGGKSGKAIVTNGNTVDIIGINSGIQIKGGII